MLSPGFLIAALEKTWGYSAILRIIQLASLGILGIMYLNACSWVGFENAVTNVTQTSLVSWVLQEHGHGMRIEFMERDFVLSLCFCDLLWLLTIFMLTVCLSISSAIMITFSLETFNGCKIPNSIPFMSRDVLGLSRVFWGTTSSVMPIYMAGRSTLPQ